MISCGIIIRNNQLHIKNLILQLLEFSDDVVIVDTGSNDGTLGIINDEFLTNDLYSDKVHLHRFKWIYDFSAARNYAFSQTRGEWIFWCDSDDVLSDELISELQNFDESSEYTVWGADYEFAPNFFIDRHVMYKSACQPLWEEPIHEYVTLQRGPIAFNKFQGVLKHSNRDGFHAKRNIDIYLRHFPDLKYPISTRVKEHFASELMDLGFDEKAYEIYKGILQDLDYDERMYILGRMYHIATTKDLDLKELLNIFNSYELRKDIHYILGLLNDRLGNTQEAIVNFKFALEEGDEIIPYAYPDNMKINPAISLVVIYDRLGDMDSARHYQKLCMKFAPNNEVVKHNEQYLNGQ